MPAVRVRIEQLVRLLEGEEIEDQVPDLGTVGDVLAVQDAGIRRREDRVRGVGQIAHQVHDVVPQAFERKPVAEDVEVEEAVVGRFAVFEGWGVEHAVVEPADEEGEVFRGDVGEGDCLGAGFAEGAQEAGAEVRGLGGEEVGMDFEGGVLGADEEGGGWGGGGGGGFSGGERVRSWMVDVCIYT